MPDKCKNFLFNKLIEDKYEEQIKNLLSFVKSKGKTLFLYEGFNFDKLVNRVVTYISENLKLQAEIRKHTAELTEILVYPKKNIIDKLKFPEKHTLILLAEKQVLKFETVPVDFIEKNKEKSKFNISSVISGSLQKKLIKYIYDYFDTDYYDKFPDKKPDTENIFIDKMNTGEQILTGELLENEKLLCKLNFYSVKKNKDTEKVSNFSYGFVAAGENSVFTVMMNENGDLIECFKINEPFLIKKSMLKKTAVKAGEYLLYPKRSDLKLFLRLPEIYGVKGNLRIKKVAEFNLEEKSFAGAEKLFRFSADRNKNPYDAFLSLLSKYLENPDNFGNIAEQKYISQTINNLADSNDAEDYFGDIFEGNKISFEDKILFLHLFSETIEDAGKLRKLTHSYESIRKKFIKNYKNSSDRAVFDFKYSEFLKKTNRNKKAAGVLKDLLKHLPDETITEVLPPETSDLFSDKSGSILKVAVLDLLARVTDKTNAPEELRNMLLLQPLNEKRLKKAAESKKKSLREKASEVSEILNGEIIPADKEFCNDDLRPVKTSLLEKHLPHPLLLEHGRYDKLRKQISEIPPNDYSSVKAYSEKADEDNYGDLYKILQNTAVVFDTGDIDLYISRTDGSNRITGYDGNPPFIIFGSDFYDDNSARKMNFAEICFSLASETACIYFKNTPLTSSDFRCATFEGGLKAAEAALTLIPPAVNVFSGSVKDAAKLYELFGLSGFSASDNTVSIYERALSLVRFYGNKKKVEKEKEYNLAAAFRLLQYTADRAGLLFCGNIASSISAVLRTSGIPDDAFSVAKESSLKEFLSEKNEDGTFKYLPVALRTANLISFYFSDDYDLLRKKILK